MSLPTKKGRKEVPFVTAGSDTVDSAIGPAMRRYWTRLDVYIN